MKTQSFLTQNQDLRMIQFQYNTSSEITGVVAPLSGHNFDTHFQHNHCVIRRGLLQQIV